MNNITRTHVVQTAATVPAVAQLSIISHRIGFPFLLDRVSVNFPPGCAYQVQLYPFISSDDSIWTTALPPGTNILSELSPLPFIVGDNQEIELDPDLPFPQKGLWLKAHLLNNDAWAHQVSIIWTLRELTLPET